MKAILSINPTASNDYFLQRMQEIGLQVIALFTTLEFPGYSKSSIKSEKYFEMIISGKNIDNDIKLISELNNEVEIIAGIIGTEVDYDYAEKILYSLFPNISNNPKNSDKRYKKFDMNQAIFLSNIPSVKQILLDDNQKIDIIIQEIKNKFNFTSPIVLKPNHGSAATVGVQIVNSDNEIESYFLEQRKALFYKTNEVVAQEMLVGDEYSVDAFSYEGNHYPASVFRYKKEKQNGKMVYRYKDILQETNPLAVNAIQYVKDCLNAIEYKYGFSHTEIINTESGFKLVEVNPRISGAHGTSNKIAKMKFNIDQFDLFSNAVLKTNVEKIDSTEYYRCFYLMNFGFDFFDINMDALKKIQSFNCIHILKSIGSKDTSSKNLVDVVAFVFLSNKDYSQIEKDTASLFEMESSGACFIK